MKNDNVFLQIHCINYFISVGFHQVLIYVKYHGIVLQENTLIFIPWSTYFISENDLLPYKHPSRVTTGFHCNTFILMVC